MIRAVILGCTFGYILALILANLDFWLLATY